MISMPFYISLAIELVCLLVAISLESLFLFLIVGPWFIQFLPLPHAFQTPMASTHHPHQSQQ